MNEYRLEDHRAQEEQKRRDQKLEQRQGQREKPKMSQKGKLQSQKRKEKKGRVRKRQTVIMQGSWKRGRKGLKKKDSIRWNGHQ